MAPTASASTFPGANGRIAFMSIRNPGNVEIYSSNPDGSDVQRLTNEPLSDFAPRWSPDGLRLLYERTGNEVWMMNADGSDKELIAANGSSPTFSPDGQRIAFVRGSDIWVMNADGSGATQLTTDPANDFWPAWSPDGTEIVFQSDRNTNYDIWKMNADGSGQTQLTASAATIRNQHPRWSPNGSTIIYDSNLANVSGSDIWTMNADGSGQATLPFAPPGSGNREFFPAYSPDGTKITFNFSSSSPSLVPEIFVADPDGSNRVNITNDTTNDEMPDWQPITTNSDLELHKTANRLKASPGDLIIYTFTATNNGPSAAHNVTVRDPGSAHLDFISGDPGCSVVASEIVCDFGTLANGQTAAKNVVLRLHPSHNPAEPPNQHLLDVIKLEQFVSPPPGGGYPQYSLTCPGGYTATDGSARTDSVDQGTGTRPGEHDVENLHFVRSESNAVNRRRWDFTLQNHATGQAQAHLFVVCLRDTTSIAAGHSHTLGFNGPITGTLAIPASGGRHEITLTCPVNTVAIAPSFEFVDPVTFAANGPHGAQYRSEQSADGRQWTFGFQTAAAARAEVSIRCVQRETSFAGGHYETLSFHQVYRRSTVGAFAGFGNSQPFSDHRVECPVHYKGITATWDLPSGLKTFGNTPEPLNRDFRLFNRTSRPLYAQLDLQCLKITTHDDLSGGDVKNDATIYGDEPDWNFANNLSTWTVQDPPATEGDSGGSGSGGDGDGGGSGGGGSGGSAEGALPETGPEKDTLSLGTKASATKKSFSVSLYCGDEDCEGTLSGDASGRALGSTEFSLAAGEDAFVSVKVTSRKARKALKKAHSLSISVELDDGSVVERRVSLSS